MYNFLREIEDIGVMLLLACETIYKKVEATVLGDNDFVSVHDIATLLSSDWFDFSEQVDISHIFPMIIVGIVVLFLLLGVKRLFDFLLQKRAVAVLSNYSAGSIILLINVSRMFPFLGKSNVEVNLERLRIGTACLDRVVLDGKGIRPVLGKLFFYRLPSCKIDSVTADFERICFGGVCLECVDFVGNDMHIDLNKILCVRSLFVTINLKRLHVNGLCLDYVRFTGTNMHIALTGLPSERRLRLIDSENLGFRGTVSEEILRDLIMRRIKQLDKFKNLDNIEITVDEQGVHATADVKIGFRVADVAFEGKVIEYAQALYFRIMRCDIKLICSWFKMNIGDFFDDILLKKCEEFPLKMRVENIEHQVGAIVVSLHSKGYKGWIP